MKNLIESYSLLDSGSGEKLERFGQFIVVRPCRLAIWRKRLSENEWKRADGIYQPGTGWTLHSKIPDCWNVDLGSCKLELSLQRNGQIGFFPEHFTYLEVVERYLKGVRFNSERPRVLNLFAYTGMLSIVAAKAGANVTHVEISKHALDWTTRNLALNNTDSQAVRLIAEDALKFLDRERRRGSKYDLVVADPPSFSRPKKGESWELEEIISGLVEDIFAVLREQGGVILTTHDFGIGSDGLLNLLLDNNSVEKVDVTSNIISLSENKSPRKLQSSLIATLFNAS